MDNSKKLNRRTKRTKTVAIDYESLLAEERKNEALNNDVKRDVRTADARPDVRKNIYISKNESKDVKRVSVRTNFMSCTDFSTSNKEKKVSFSESPAEIFNIYKFPKANKTNDEKIQKTASITNQSIDSYQQITNKIDSDMHRLLASLNLLIPFCSKFRTPSRTVNINVPSLTKHFDLLVSKNKPDLTKLILLPSHVTNISPHRIVSQIVSDETSLESSSEEEQTFIGDRMYPFDAVMSLWKSRI
ncbi:hypothetical protein NGRA_1704 [Nosema granulosis]|uniref:Uncharacterized protein n=1 Tax=Nosema granulosis TaxID=83296 RepID=A0A9P6GYY4_9MICR|nr:hypothetical protein NGRA_1704 [Nosema granulosis]